MDFLSRIKPPGSNPFTRHSPKFVGYLKYKARRIGRPCKKAFLIFDVCHAIFRVVLGVFVLLVWEVCGETVRCAESKNYFEKCVDRFLRGFVQTALMCANS